ncbi:MAG: transcription elongation factor GreA [Gemmatimonadetes bacterium]|nr:MAG: transcription elongation factor GreA [Gemmatimonadota bacterium]
MEPIYMTRATLNRLKDEAQYLERELKTTIAEEISKAAALGDLSENAEYDAAKDKQRTFATKLQNVMMRMNRAQLIETLSISGTTISIGTRAHLLNLHTGEEITYTILGEGDYDLEKNIIAYSAPIAKSLMTKQRGEVVTIKVPAGEEEFIVMNIEKVFN